MNERKHFGAAVSDDPDDAPELLAAFFEDAEQRVGETIVRPAGTKKNVAPQPELEPIFRLDPDLRDRLRSTGPGWQARLNKALRAWLELGTSNTG